MDEKRTINQATVIKIAAVATALPRWAGSLMVSEGVPLPTNWLDGWRYLVLALSFGMAVVEAFGISYMLHRARIQGDKKSRWLTPLVIANLAVFAILVAPYAFANMRGISVSDALPVASVAWLWAIAVPVSTGALVAGVGFADRSKDESTESPGGQSTKGPKGATKDELLDLIVETIMANPGQTQAWVMDKVGLPKSTFYKYRRELVDAGRLSVERNGNEQ